MGNLLQQSDLGYWANPHLAQHPPRPHHVLNVVAVSNDARRDVGLQQGNGYADWNLSWSAWLAKDASR